MTGKRFYEDYPVTACLLLLNIAFFFLEVIAHSKLTGEFPGVSLVGGVAPDVTRRLGSLNLHDVRAGEYWRLLSAPFLHAGMIHLLMNCIVLFDMGRLCEPFLSSWKFLVAYVGSAIGGSLGSLFYTLLLKEKSVEAMRSSVGASGALCGLIGILLVYSIKEGMSEMRDALLRWIGMIVVFSLVVPSLDHAAHAGGFLVGCLFGLTVSTYIVSKAAERWRYPGYLAVLLLAGSLSLGLWNYFGS